MTPIASIKIGRRHRRDLGDVQRLADSIAQVGLLHPVVVNSNGKLIAGKRRLEACKLLGWNKIPTTVIDLDEIVRGEFAENAIRKDFLPSEIDAIRRAVEPAEKAAAKRRMTLGKVSPGSDKGKSSDRIGAFAGVSGRQVEKIAIVSEAARANPDRWGHLPDEMDQTGKVNAAYAQVRRHQRHDEIHEAARTNPALDTVGGPYPLIYADPPCILVHGLCPRMTCRRCKTFCTFSNSKGEPHK
jgi:ParB family chromosome partitioning protein